ncbi:MAG TPA: diaminobutyrate--2-oxoglutarate transaminase, partial [Acidimicrobiales bacterium]
MELFEQLESDVRGYIRSWPTVFETGHGWTLIDEKGREYLDFFAGAGALNYGHNHPVLVEAAIEHLRSGRVVHGLDMATTTKRTFLERFQELVLEPRDLRYKLQFPGPTGTNAVEAALKLARKITGRDRIVGFTNAFHGMTLGALAVTGNSMKRAGAGVPLTYADSLPFAGFLGDDPDTVGYFEAFLADGTGLDNPAAVIVETVQAEGGINVAGFGWLRRLDEACKRHGILLIIDDIQVGCGRTGPFFSWEEAGIDPDIVCLSKSLSGLGLPFALTLIKPEHDVWAPGEHNGTFRGNNPAFATATAALEVFWSDDTLRREVDRKAALVTDQLNALARRHEGLYDEVRGRGLIQGVQATDPEVAGLVTQEAFERGLLVETAGPSDEVVKLLPPLIVDDDAIRRAV